MPDILLAAKFNWKIWKYWCAHIQSSLKLPYIETDKNYGEIFVICRLRSREKYFMESKPANHFSKWFTKITNSKYIHPVCVLRGKTNLFTLKYSAGFFSLFRSSLKARIFNPWWSSNCWRLRIEYGLNWFSRNRLNFKWKWKWNWP